MTINKNEFEEVMRNHWSIRKFTADDLPTEQIDRLLATAQRSATSQYMQSYSVIRIKSPEMYARLSEIGNHNFARDHGNLVMFVADQRRNIELIKDIVDNYSGLINFDRFMSGVFDGTLAAQALVTAAESEGLGTLTMSSFWDDAAKTIAVLNLPKYTFPLLGVVMGHGVDETQQKPRLPKAIFEMTDTYTHGNDYDQQMKAYDQKVLNYYNTRDGQPRHELFSQMIGRYASKTLPIRDGLAELVEKQGFNFSLK